jgi:PKD repeat protein
MIRKHIFTSLIWIVILALALLGGPSISLAQGCPGPPAIINFSRHPGDPVMVGDSVEIDADVSNDPMDISTASIVHYAALFQSQSGGCLEPPPIYWELINQPVGSATTLITGDNEYGSLITFSRSTFTPDLPGVYQVRMTATNAYGITTRITTITVGSDCNAPPAIAINSVIPGTEISVDDNVLLTGSAGNTNAACTRLVTSWSLAKPASSTTSLSSNEGNSTSFKADVPGSYQVTFSATNDVGTSSLSRTITASGDEEVGTFGITEEELPEGTLTVATLNPTSGIPGTLVVISGRNFSLIFSENLVFFGSLQAQVVAATSTTLTVVVPNLPDGFYAITVTVVSSDIEQPEAVSKVNLAQPEQTRKAFQDASNIVLFEINQKSAARMFTSADVDAGYLLGEFLIFFEDGVGELQIEALQSEFEFESLVHYPDLGFYRARDPESNPGQTLVTLNQLNQDPRVDAAFLNSLMDILQVNDPDIASQGWLLSLGLPEGYDAFFPKRGEGITIAIIDTGADLTLPSEDLAELTFPSSAPQGMNFSPVRDDPSGFDELGHGTVVSTIAAASSNQFNGLGVAHAATILTLKVFTIVNGQIQASNEGVSEALLQAYEQEADIINMSLGCMGCSAESEQSLRDYYQRIIDNLIANQIAKGKKLPILVAASGNDGESIIDSPAAANPVIAVGAISSDLSAKSSFSNYGPELDFVAVGEDINTTVLGGAFANSGSGTSFSAPQVAGLIGLILAERPGLDVEAVIEVIKDCFSEDLGSVGFDNETGWGRIVVPTSVHSGCDWENDNEVDL